MKETIYIFTDNAFFFSGLSALSCSCPQLQRDFEIKKISSGEIKSWLRKGIISQSLIMAGPDMEPLIRLICIQSCCDYLRPDFRPKEMKNIILRESRRLGKEGSILMAYKRGSLQPTKQELAILSWYLIGLTPNQMAKNYGLSIKTISRHKRNLMEKMQIDSDIRLYEVGFQYYNF